MARYATVVAIVDRLISLIRNSEYLFAALHCGAAVIGTRGAREVNAALID
tara:strand:- start:247 stop:396 length:150 start_codon:yes stop_codon:yes gene_type:complete